MSEMKSRVKVSPEGRITIPKPVRKQLGLKTGSILELWTIKDKRIVLDILAR